MCQKARNHRNSFTPEERKALDKKYNATYQANQQKKLDSMSEEERNAALKARRARKAAAHQKLAASWTEEEAEQRRLTRLKQNRKSYYKIRGRKNPEESSGSEAEEISEVEPPKLRPYNTDLKRKLAEAEQQSKHVPEHHDSLPATDKQHSDIVAAAEHKKITQTARKAVPANTNLSGAAKKLFGESHSNNKALKRTYSDVLEDDEEYLGIANVFRGKENEPPPRRSAGASAQKSVNYAEKLLGAGEFIESDCDEEF